MAESIVEVERLSKHVSTGDGTLVILHEISFSVSYGETVAIVGASGSGKSTLLGLIAGLDLASTGSVSLNGRQIGTLSEDQRAELRGHLIGFVFQSFQLLPTLSAIENVALPLELMASERPVARAEAMLQRVGLGQRLKHYPKHLSGGEQQRVALARAFAVAPKLLLADEPTGNLDPVTGAEIIELMFEMNREAGTTLMLVTHDETLARRCGRTLHLVAGKLVDY